MANSFYVASSQDGTGAQTGLGIVAAVLLILAIALSYVPGQASVPPIDRDEPRYTQATKQMIETGDFVEIRFQEAPRHKKPVGIHWLQVGAVTLSGDGASAPLWVYRLPSLLGAMAALLLAVWAARAFLPWPLALTAGTLFGATIILGVEARLAKTDAVLLATILAAQGALARIWLAEQSGRAMAVLFWGALGAGILVKGPIAPMVCGLTIATLTLIDRRRLWAKLYPLMGVVIVAAVCLPWYVAIYRATDGAFFSAALGRDFFGKATSGQEGHGAPPLVHLAFFLGVAWPLAPFAVAAIWRAVRQRSDAVIFAFAWVVPAWIVFELTPTKLPHYTLPLLPAVAIAAVATLSAVDAPRIMRRIAAAMIVATPVIVAAAAPVIVMQLGTIGEQSAALLDGFPLFLAVGLMLIAIAAASVAAARIWRGASMVAGSVVAPTLAAAIVAQSVVWGIALPSFAPVWISTRLVAAADEAAPCPNPRLASVGGYNEPSMIFLAGTDTALVEPDEAVAILMDECAVVAARERSVADVRAAAEAVGLTVAEVGYVEGFNISKGDPIRLTLFARAAEQR